MIMIQKNKYRKQVDLRTDKIKAKFDRTLNTLNYANMLVSSSSNDTYTFKKILHQSSVK